ncbi:MAG: GNAT family protein [Acidimicrobiia bacterium]
MTTNHLGQPVGNDLGAWRAPSFPETSVMEGHTVTLERLDVERHGTGLWGSLSEAPEATWTYMSFGPFSGYDRFEEILESLLAYKDWVPYAIVVDGAPMGFASYLRINPLDGVIEIGSITFSPSLQRTTPATESLYLMIRHVFDLGYRRCEWKCDDLNAPSRSAADRLGFTYEGTFRQATHYKGRNRDTAWYSIIDSEWPALDGAFTAWLDPENFDEKGSQLSTLEEMRNR